MAECTYHMQRRNYTSKRTNEKELCEEYITDDSDNKTPEELFILKLETEELYKALELLEPIQRTIIWKRYGLETGTVKKLREISEEIGEPLMKIHYQEKKAIQKLRRLLSA